MCQRYVDESGCRFVIPPDILRAKGKALMRFMTNLLKALDSYNEMVEVLSKTLAEGP